MLYWKFLSCDIIPLLQEKEGFDFTLLDIGGGFPGHEVLNDVFIEVARTVNDCVSELFSKYPNIMVIAEPGNQRV